MSRKPHALACRMNWHPFKNIFRKIWVRAGLCDHWVARIPTDLAWWVCQKDKHERATLVRIYELSIESLQDYEIIYFLPLPDKIIQDGIREQKDGDGLNIFNDIKIFLETHAKDLYNIIDEFS